MIPPSGGRCCWAGSRVAGLQGQIALPLSAINCQLSIILKWLDDPDGVIGWPDLIAADALFIYSLPILLYPAHDLGPDIENGGILALLLAGLAHSALMGWNFPHYHLAARLNFTCDRPADFHWAIVIFTDWTVVKTDRITGHGRAIILDVLAQLGQCFGNPRVKVGHGDVFCYADGLAGWKCLDCYFD